ncbi:MAG: pyridoxal phosphate-dependent aminotransferase [Pseudomonadota bacterium]|nr:pyridoxal phosphate-dependent aminotransferase [Pseudomonadota bacterium]
MRFASMTDRLQGLGSDKWRVHTEGAKRRARGEDVIMLSIGEPDFSPPAAIMDVAASRMRAGRTRYSTGRGEPEVVEAIARKYSRRTGRAIATDQVAFLPGAQTALFAVFMTLVEKGDDVLIPDPYYATYEGVIAATGAHVVPMPLDPDGGFHLTAADLERAVTPVSRALLLNTPSNPTGAVVSAPAIAAIGEVCARHGLWIVCDEVYSDLVYQAEFASPFDDPRLCERTVVVSSVSKSHAMPGFRCGWAVGPKEFCDRLLPLSETMLFGSQPFLEDATAFALDNDFDECRAMRDAYFRRARLVVEALSNAPGLKAPMPEAGMFIMADVRRTGLSGDAFAWRLLEEERVATMPGESFGIAAKGHVRISLTASDADMAEACRRIVRFARSAMAGVPTAPRSRTPAPAG